MTPKWHRPGRLALANAAGWGNFGDDAIVASIAGALADQGRFSEFYEIGGPLGAEALAPLGAVRSDFGHRGRMASNLSRSSLLVIGGGGLLQDHLGPFYRVFIRAARVANLARVPFAVVGVGAYEPTTDPFRRDLEWLADKATHFSVRDSESQAIVGAYGPTPTVIPDPAFALDLPPAAASTRSIGVALRPWWHLAEMWDKPDPARLTALVESVADVVAPIAKNNDLAVQAICMHIGTADDDSGVSAAFVQSVRRHGVDAEVVRPSNYVEAQSALGSCRAVVAMRLHALILAAAQGVPTFGISYDQKVARTMRALGRDDCTTDLELSNRASWIGQIESAVMPDAPRLARPEAQRQAAIAGLRAIIRDLD